MAPDLTTMAKAMGGGFPVAVYGGRADIMVLLADASVLRAGILIFLAKAVENVILTEEQY